MTNKINMAYEIKKPETREDKYSEANPLFRGIYNAQEEADLTRHKYDAHLDKHE